jgi:hypothetical protein
MDGACSTYGTDEKCLKIVVGKPSGQKRKGDLRVDKRIILK